MLTSWLENLKKNVRRNILVSRKPRRRRRPFARLASTLEPLETRTLLAAGVIAGADRGGGPHVRIFDETEVVGEFFAYDPEFRGGVRVASGDVNGDGVPDIITGAGRGGGPHVKVFDGNDPTGQTLLHEFAAFDPNFSGGIFVAAGNFDADSTDVEILVGADAGGGPHVKIFKITFNDAGSFQAQTELASFFAYGAAFRGGVRVAAADVNNDGRDDIITGAGPGGGPHVRVFSGMDLTGGTVLPGLDFFAYDGEFRGGAYVAAGNFDSDPNAEIVTGAGASGGPHVKTFDHNGDEIGSFFAYDSAFRGGVRVGTTLANDDAIHDIITGAGPGGGPHVRVLDGTDLSGGTQLASDFAFDPFFRGGVFVSGHAEEVETPPANTPPVAVTDEYETDPDAELMVDAEEGLLANDTDADDDTLVVGSVNGSAANVGMEITLTSGAAMTVNANGSFTYTPAEGFTGEDTFTYQANDGTANSNIATVTITVGTEEPSNTPPVAMDDEYQTEADTPLIIADPAQGVLANDEDDDGDDLTAVLVTPPQNGTVVFNTDGTFTYTPNEDFVGEDTFTYRANDGTDDSNVATVTIVVGTEEPSNTPPVAVDDEYQTEVDTPLIIIDPAQGVLANDDDEDDDELTAVLLTPPANGELTLNADGTFTYTPDEGFEGEDTFTYRANDGTDDSNVATVTIVVGTEEPSNTPPVAVDDEYQTEVDTPLIIIDPALGVLANDDDEDDDELTAVLLTPPANGELTLNADGTFTYTPDEGFVGEDTFTYRANDGIADSNVATGTIVVGTEEPSNTPPVAVDDEYQTEVDIDLTVDAVVGLLANDDDADGDMLVVLTVNGLAGNVGVEITLTSGAFLTVDADGAFFYAPPTGFTGEETFTYTVSDGTANSNVATVTIAVGTEEPSNTPPVAVDDEFQTEVDTPLIITDPAQGVLANDEDEDGDELTAAVVTPPANGDVAFNADGTFTYTPDEGFEGEDTFTYQASDGTANSNIATVTIMVGAEEPSNTPPVAVNDAYQTDLETDLTVDAQSGLLANDDDADGDMLSVLTVNGLVGNVGLEITLTSGALLTVGADGAFFYAPPIGFTGEDAFTYTAGDGTGESNEATVTIDVGPASETEVNTEFFAADSETFLGESDLTDLSTFAFADLRLTVDGSSTGLS